MSKADFDEFWKIAQHWRDGADNYPGHAAPIFHKLLKGGHDPAEIKLGAENFTQQVLAHREAAFHPSAVKWLSGWGWMNYQQEPVKFRPLTPEERQAWQEAGMRGPDKAKEGQPCWPPGLRVVI